MANWAIVVGVDKYWTERACLRGAVRDALAMREWLVDPNGGDVPAKNLTLLLSPDKTAPPAGLDWREATRSNLVSAIEDLFTRSGKRGDRFFFHFSGHGMTARIDLSDESGIVPSDFTAIETDKTLTVRSLFELFQGTSFAEQFFFIDACRNIPFDLEKRLGPYPNPLAPVPPVSPQYVIFATMPRKKAIEVQQPGDEHGAFTNALLAGLRGKGSAKRYDEETGEFVVRWTSLFEYIVADVTSRRLAVGAGPNGPEIQIPRRFGEQGVENPVLARLDPAAFGDEDLAVDIRPPGTREIATVEVLQMGGSHTKTPPLATLPVPFRLPPRTYAVRASAPGHRSRPLKRQVDLYQSSTVVLDLEPLPPGDVVPESPAAVRSLGGTRGLGPPEKGTLTVRSADALATIEVADSSGRTLRRGRSPVVLDDIEAGFYRGRLLSPEGDVREEAFEVDPGERTVVDLSAPPVDDPMCLAMMGLVGWTPDTDNTVSPSEAVGPSASLRPSTLLALAAAAKLERHSDYGKRLQELAEPWPRARDAGLQVIIGDELAADGAAQAELACWPLDEERPVVPLPFTADPRLPGVGCATASLAPGPYWVSVQIASGAELTMPIAVLRERVTILVVVRGADGRTDVHLYAFALPGPAAQEVHNEDPRFSATRFAAIRRIEAMQRSVASGRISPTQPDIDALLYDKWQDPIAGCLGGYLLVRMGRTEQLAVPTQNLVSYFAELPDSHVLMAVLQESRGDLQFAAMAFGEALNRGFPVFRDGLALLGAAVERHGLQHPRVEQLRTLLGAVPAGSLWSARPETAELVEYELAPA